MIRTILTQRFASNLDYAKRLVDGLSEEQANHQPSEGVNTPRWILGHLVQTADQVTLGIVWEQPRSLEAWDAWFDAGTQAADLPADAPTLAETLTQLERLHGEINEVIAASQPAVYERSLPTSAPQGFRDRFPTIGSALTHTMLLHEMQHLGQLSAWRRIQGLPSV